jgi:hypothetical protein
MRKTTTIMTIERDRDDDEPRGRRRSRRGGRRSRRDKRRDPDEEQNREDRGRDDRGRDDRGRDDRDPDERGRDDRSRDDRGRSGRRKRRDERRSQPSPRFFNTGQRVSVLLDLDSLEDAAQELFNGSLNLVGLIDHLLSGRRNPRAIAYASQDSRALEENLGAAGFDSVVIENRRSKRIVQLAMDAVALAMRTDVILIGTADEALSPIAEQLRAHGVRVEFASFEDDDFVDVCQRGAGLRTPRPRIDVHSLRHERRAAMSLSYALCSSTLLLAALLAPTGQEAGASSQDQQPPADQAPEDPKAEPSPQAPQGARDAAQLARLFDRCQPAPLRRLRCRWG